MSWIAPKSSPAGAAPRTRPLVLVIDDEEDLCRILTMALEREGWEVDRAHDGVEGLAKAHALRPSIILLDIKMPQMNGYQVLTRLQQDPALAQTPILIISMIDEAARHAPEEWCARLGVQGYFPKPFEPAAAIERIHEILGPHPAPGGAPGA